MFRQSQEVTHMSKDEIKSELKEILIDIRLLQLTCIHFSNPLRRPRKFSHLSESQAQNLQRSLSPRMRELGNKLSEEEFLTVSREADKEANWDKNTPRPTSSFFRSRDSVVQSGATVQFLDSIEGYHRPGGAQDIHASDIVRLEDLFNRRHP